MQIIDQGTVDSIKNAITPLADKIGQGVGHVYYVYVRQQFVVGITDIVRGVLELVALGIIAWLVNKLWRPIYLTATSGDGDIGVQLGLVFVVPLLGMLIAYLCSDIFNYLPDAVGHMVNPEYYAIQDIINTVKQ